VFCAAADRDIDQAMRATRRRDARHAIGLRFSGQRKHTTGRQACIQNISSSV
jgi:ribosomal protein S13